jgi:predicted O-methyltransferase YrrM
VNRTDVLNVLMKRRKYVSYLEIGVRNPRHNFVLVQAARKDGVDPAGRCSHVMTSDEFFSRCQTRYDLIFIDGLHTEDQVARDIAGALRCLAPYGTLALHDCNPPTAWHQSETDNGGAWNGTVWRAFTRFRHEHRDYQAFVVDCDWGVGACACP